MSRSSIAPTMAFNGAAGASMRRPPGARRVTSAVSSMVATSRASSQRASRVSRSASSGARSSVSPSTSTPRLSMNEPSRGGWRSAVSGCTRGPGGWMGSISSRPCSSPVARSMTSRQRSTVTLWWAKPGCTTMDQPSACSRGTCSAQKSPNRDSSGNDHRCAWPTPASWVRHCSACIGSGRRPLHQSASRASASAARSRCSSVRSCHAPRSSCCGCRCGCRCCVGFGRVFSTLAGAGVSQRRPVSVV